MFIRKPVVGFKPIILGIMIVQMGIMHFSSSIAQADAHFRIERDPQGLIVPFKAVMLPLPDFVREYGRATSTQIVVGGKWDQELKGSVTLFLRHPLKQEELTDIFHRVLNDNGYAALDGSAGNGLVIEKSRDARDDALPFYEASEVPESSRLVTAYHDLKYANAENVARMMRSFMPAYSRIIPASKSQVFITDTATNIRKLNWLISRLDTQEAAKRQSTTPFGSSYGPPRVCGEHRIEKLVVEKLEIQDNSNIGQSPQIKQVKRRRQKVKTPKKLWIAGLMLLSLPCSVFATNKQGQIQFKAGEMGILSFLEMVSEKLDLQIDASTLGANLGTVMVPNIGPLSPDRAKALVLSSLYLQGYTWIHDVGTDLYRVMSQRDARDQETPVITDAAQLPDNDLLVTYSMPTEHISPEYIARIARSFMPANSRIIPDEATRSVLITDSARNIIKLKKIIQRVDTPETVKQEAEWLTAYSKRANPPCPGTIGEGQNSQPGVLLIVLFSMIALVIGFLVRGYVIRRIEGGL